MHELFTTAVVQDAQVGEVLKILQGLCGMTPVRQLERRLTFEGPKAPPLIAIGPSLLQSRKPTNMPYWRELNEQLLRQSYYITVSYEILDSLLNGLLINGSDTPGGDLPIMNIEELRGTLLFFDNPDPPGIRPVNSRLTIQIKDEPQLPAFLGQISYSYSSERIREMQYAYRENVVFCLSRELLRSKKTDTELASASSHAIPDTHPTFEELQLFDAENKWAFTASVYVSDGNQPLLMQKGLDELAQVKHEFTGIFDFGVIPRQQLDTRVQSYNQSLRA